MARKEEWREKKLPQDPSIEAEKSTMAAWKLQIHLHLETSFK
jgi:hypothetical protein